MTQGDIWARADAIGILLNHPATKDLDWPSVFAKLDLDIEALQEHLVSLPFDKFTGAFEAVADALGSDSILLDIYRELPQGQLSVFDYLLLCAPTLREGLQAWVNLIRMRMSELHYRYVETETDGGVEWPSLADFGSPRQNMYARVAWAVGRLELALDQVPAPVCIRFEGAAPRSPCRFLQLYDGRVRFGQPADGIYLPKDYLDAEPKRKDTALFDLLTGVALQEIETLRESHSEDKRLAQVAHAISVCLASGTCNLERVSSHLGVSPRTLQRILLQNEQSFRSMVDDVRKKTALRYLTETDLSLKEISYLLGFSQVSAFSRSARNWFGKPPREMRQPGRGSAPGKAD